MYAIWRITGFSGLIVVFAALLAIAFYALFLRCGPATYIAGLATICGAWATAPLWGARPQVISIMLTSVWLFILERSERDPRLLWWTLPLTLLWVNLHAGFALGLVLFALFLVASFFDERQRLRDHPHWRTAGLIFLLDLLMVPLNPNGWRMFFYPVETLRSAAMQTYILEWASPNFHRAEYWPFLVIILGTFVTVSFSSMPLRPRDLILLLVGLYAGLVSIRMIPLFILLAVPIIATGLGDWPHSRPLGDARLRTIFHAAILASMCIFTGARVAYVIHTQAQAEAREFPSRAVAFLLVHPPSGPIFNHYDWGGYLIWKLYPSTRVFIDGRADLYGGPLLHDFAETYEFRGRWQQVLHQWRISTVIVPPNSALATGLQNAPGWTVSYRDSQAIILTSTLAASQIVDARRRPFR
jgi:hypothetical protein